LLDRGFDRDELMLPWLKSALAFVIRQRGDRHMVLADGRKLALTALAAELKPPAWPKRWPKAGYTTCQDVSFPEASDHALLFVAHRRKPSAEPLMLLVSPAARRPGSESGTVLVRYSR
jgi:hypothetical protein